MSTEQKKDTHLTSLAPERTPVIIGVGEFSDRLGPDHAGFEPRDLLATAMRAGGFAGIANEWWHFDHGDRDRVRRELPRVL